MPTSFDIRRRDITIGYLRAALTSIAEGRIYHFENAADYAKEISGKVTTFHLMTDREFRAEFHLPAEDEPDMYREALNHAEAA